MTRHRVTDAALIEMAEQERQQRVAEYRADVERSARLVMARREAIRVAALQMAERRKAWSVASGGVCHLLPLTRPSGVPPTVGVHRVHILPADRDDWDSGDWQAWIEEATR